MSGLWFDEGFFEKYWRKEPVLLDGYEAGPTARPPTVDDYTRYVESAGELGVRLRTDDKTVWFLERVVEEVPYAAELVRHARKTFEWDDIWCDLFMTRGPSSIGCHFDNSDNFSIQLSGTKRWRLSPPSSIPPDDIRRRLLNEPGVGSAQLGTDVRAFTLNPGDVLYIPALWVHWGESESDSTSVSLVVNCRTAFEELHEAVQRTLRRDPAWWRPLPVGPGSAALRKAHSAEAVTATFMPSVRHEILTLEGPAMSQAVSRAPVPFRIDVDRVRGFVGSAPDAPRDGLLLPGNDDTNLRLRGLLARRTLRRLLKAIAQRVAQTASADDRRLYQLATDTVLGLPDDRLVELCTEPEIISWVAVAETAAEPQVARVDDPLAAHLATVLLPELAESGASVVVPVGPDADGAFTIRRAGLRLVPSAPAGHAYFAVDDGAVCLASPDGPIPLHAGNPVPGFTVEALPTLLDDGPHVLSAPSSWMSAHIPGELTTTDDVRAFHTALLSGATVLSEHWPEAWRELTQSIRCLLPLPSRGHEPYNYSVHGFRGLILSSPRKSYLAAQTLVHETAHNKMSTLVDLFPICRNPDQTVHSPVVRAERPLINVFHGAYAFSQELVLTKLLMGVVPDLPGLSMERYLGQTTEKVAAALDVLERTADPEPVGQALITELRAVLDRRDQP